MVGNAQCFGHVQVNSIIAATPASIRSRHHRQLSRRPADPEAAISKIAGDQLLKLETLELDAEGGGTISRLPGTASAAPRHRAKGGALPRLRALGGEKWYYIKSEITSPTSLPQEENTKRLTS